MLKIRHSLILFISLFVTPVFVFAEHVMVPVGLNMQASPQENGVVMLTVYMTVNEDVEKAVLHIKPPSGGRLYEGQMRWEGDLRKGNTVKLVSWYDLSGLKEGNAAGWRVIAGGTMDGAHRFKMQPLFLNRAQMARLVDSSQQLSALPTAKPVM